MNKTDSPEYLAKKSFFNRLITVYGRKPVLAAEFPKPPEPRLGRNLVLGSTLFGMGWGLVGLCPGPAIASISFGGFGGLLFVVAMVGGMAVAPPIRTRLDQLETAV